MQESEPSKINYNERQPQDTNSPAQTTEFNDQEDTVKLETERAARRKQTARALIDKELPPKNFEQLIASQENTTVDKLTPDKKRAAQSLKFDELHNKDGLAGIIAAREIDDENLATYTQTILEIAKTLEGSDDIYIRGIENYVHASKDLPRARTYLELARRWKSRFLNQEDKDIRQKRANIFNEFVTETSGHHRWPTPAPRSDQEIRELYEATEEVYDFGFSLPESYNPEISSQITRWSVNVGLERRDAQQTRQMLKLFKEVVSFTDEHTLELFSDAAVRYATHHGLTDQKRYGLVHNLLPAMARQEPQTSILLRSGNIWGMRIGDFGIGDYICHTYAQEVNPGNINELILISREVPTTDTIKFEQNRLDALSLARPFGALRDYIHDQGKGANELISAMVEYYEDKKHDPKRLTELATKTKGYLGPPDRQALLLDLRLYDSEVAGRGDEEGKSIKVIDILRRLRESTKPIPDLPPKTSDEELNQMLERLEEAKRLRDNPKEELGETLGLANQKLIKMIQGRQIGTEPSFISALSWLDRQANEVLQKLSYEEQMGAHRQEWFREILRFQELVASPSYDETNFAKFLKNLDKTESDQDAYKMIQKRVIIYLNELARRYKDIGRGERVGALWSGNTAHRLIGMVDLKPAGTLVGKKLREENARPEHERLRGD